MAMVVPTEATLETLGTRWEHNIVITVMHCKCATSISWNHGEICFMWFWWRPLLSVLQSTGCQVARGKSRLVYASTRSCKTPRPPHLDPPPQTWLYTAGSIVYLSIKNVVQDELKAMFDMGVIAQWLEQPHGLDADMLVHNVSVWCISTWTTWSVRHAGITQGCWQIPAFSTPLGYTRGVQSYPERVFIPIK